MANFDFPLNPIADPQIAHRSETELSDVLAIEVEVPGLMDGVSVYSPAQPGAVRGAVEKLLHDLGLPRL